MLRKGPIWSENKVGNGRDEAPLSIWLSGEPRGSSGNASVRANTAGRSRACHRIAQGEKLKLQLVLPFNDRSYRTVETRHVLRGSVAMNAVKDYGRFGVMMEAKRFESESNLNPSSCSLRLIVTLKRH